jgi:hypothetical protein
MKRNLILLAIVTLLPIYAFGDFIPGRVRVAARAVLTRSQGNGRYAKTEGARALEWKADGLGFTKFQISLDKRPMIPFAITEVQPNRCGRSILGQTSEEGRITRLRIDEITPLGCRNGRATLWRVTLLTRENGGSLSHLVMQGEPEFLALSQ